MKKTESHADLQHDVAAEETPKRRRVYVAPRVEKRRSLARVTLLSGMGATGVGVISTMN